MNKTINPQISVIVPVYKAEEHLSRCIESILNQTFRNLELILIDDGSPDNSGRICDQYSRFDERVFAYHQDNKGASASRNLGIEKSKGVYILFVDSDDYLEPGYIETLYNNRTELTICGIIKENENGTVLSLVEYESCQFNEDINYSFLFKSSEIYSPYCKLFLSSLIKENNIKFPLGIQWGEDGVFIADYLEHIKSVNYLSYVGYHYVRYNGEQSLSTTLRCDVLDDVIYTREYCIKKIGFISDDYSSEVKDIITKNIILNCADFVKRLLDSSLSFREKEKVLKVYLSNDYTQKSIYEYTNYYSKIQLKSLRCRNAKLIILVYEFLKKETTFKNRMKKNKRTIKQYITRR